MRTELLSYFKTLTLTNFAVSLELPFTSSNTVMYLKNPKKVYVDMDQKARELLIPVLGNHGVSQEVHSVSAYLTTDAKNLPSNYDAVITSLTSGVDVVSTTTNYFKREVSIGTSFEGDLMVTQLDFRFTKLT